MIKVPSPIPEPKHFKTNCETPGAAWLVANPDKDPRAMSHLWAAFKHDLAGGFSGRCGYLATTIHEGHVDHFLSCKFYRRLAFNWTNYRWLCGSLNEIKGTLDDQLLDPFEIRDGWFEIHLPTFHLILTDKIPDSLREKAAFTLERLKLSDSYTAVNSRWNWYRSHWNGGQINMEGLRGDAPLIAEAVERAQIENRPLPDPEECKVSRPPIIERKRKYSKRASKEKKPNP